MFQRRSGVIHHFNLNHLFVWFFIYSIRQHHSHVATSSYSCSVGAECCCSRLCGAID